MILKGSEVEIRPVGEPDLDAILEVYRECEDFLALGPQPRASLQMVRDDLAISREMGGVFCGVFDPSGRLLGVVDFIPSGFEGYSSHAFLTLLMIGRPWRSKGFGTEVVRLVEAEIATDPRVTDLLSGVQVNNPDAIRFWERMGYQVVSAPRLLPDGTTAVRLWKPMARSKTEVR